MEAKVKFYEQQVPINVDIRGVKFGTIPMFLIKTGKTTFYVNPNSIQNIVTK